MESDGASVLTYGGAPASESERRAAHQPAADALSVRGLNQGGILIHAKTLS